MKNIQISIKQKLYSYLVDLYPDNYKRRFAVEMEETFSEMLIEAYQQKGEGGVKQIWRKTLLDIPQSLVKEHVDEAATLGLRKYGSQTLHISKLNVIGAMLLFPFTLIFCLDIISRLLQGNVSYPNQALYAYLQHTPLYSFPVLVTWVLIFPLLSIVITLYSVALSTMKQHQKIFTLSYTGHYFISFGILGVALLYLAIFAGHDMFPCIINNLMQKGLPNVFSTINYCRIHS